MDELDKLTDKQLAQLERKLHKLYKDAADEMDGTIKEYFDKFAKRDEDMKASLDNGEITKEQYTQWRLAQIGRGQRFEDLRDKLAERMTKANEVAAAYMNDTTPGVYSLNMNYTAYSIEQSYGAVGFTVWSDETIRRLALEDPDLMPYYPEAKAVNRGIDLAYGKRQITAQVTSSILLGHSIPQMADALRRRIEGMSNTSATRTARTAVTAAQNGGRQATLERAAAMGIKLRKRWVATKDLRTRPEHGHADGQTVPVDEPFDVGGEKLMFPGDRSNASGWNIYNCRCAMRSVEKEGIEAEPRMMRVRDPATGRNVLVKEMTYAEWYESKTGQPFNRLSKMASGGSENNDWSQTQPRLFSQSEKQQIVRRAKSNNITIGDIDGFDGDPKLLELEIDTIAMASKEYNIKSPITVSARVIDDEDFAVTDLSTNTITFNTKALRNREITEINIATANKFAEKTVEDIALHEILHVFAEERKLKPLAIAKTAYYNTYTVYASPQFLGEYIGTTISANALVRREIVPEIIVAHKNNPSPFTTNYMALIREELKND